MGLKSFQRCPLVKSLSNRVYKWEIIEQILNEVDKYLLQIKEHIFLLIKEESITKEDSDNYELRNFISQKSIKLFNKPFLILDSNAGTGKSHLLADVIRSREKERLKSVFLLGQNFTTTVNLEKQILAMLDLLCTFGDFLDALNCIGQISQSRVIIFIDAINEGRGKEVWLIFLNGIISKIQKYEWLGLVLSVRTSYLRLFSENIKSNIDLITQCTHNGFHNIEYKAALSFFSYYNIEFSRIPLLNPEFNNPLFLKLFCEGMSKFGYTKIPDGFIGITAIFDFFINSINKAISS